MNGGVLAALPSVWGIDSARFEPHYEEREKQHYTGIKCTHLVVRRAPSKIAPGFFCEAITNFCDSLEEAEAICAEANEKPERDTTYAVRVVKRS